MIREMLLIGHHTALFFCHSQHKDRRRNVPQRVGAVFALSIDCMWLEIQSLLIESNTTRAKIAPHLFDSREEKLPETFRKRDIDEQICLQVPFCLCI